MYAYLIPSLLRPVEVINQLWDSTSLAAGLTVQKVSVVLQRHIKSGKCRDVANQCLRQMLGFIPVHCPHTLFSVIYVSDAADRLETQYGKSSLGV